MEELNCKLRDCSFDKKKRKKFFFKRHSHKDLNYVLIFIKRNERPIGADGPPRIDDAARSAGPTRHPRGSQRGFSFALALKISLALGARRRACDTLRDRYIDQDKDSEYSGVDISQALLLARPRILFVLSNPRPNNWRTTARPRFATFIHFCVGPPSSPLVSRALSHAAPRGIFGSRACSHRACTYPTITSASRVPVQE
ncbi:hypothetical protein PUN28_013333 [Cardiocondyla obscurior]|uniref:Uncharacterized protein n=1 Tax=Cardiocondyla obscurior TaxID=286306 RepID=A0AAW2F979_9HYME